MDHIKEQLSFNPQDQVEGGINSQVLENEQLDQREKTAMNQQKNKRNEAQGLPNKNTQEQQVGQKRKYTKRMQANKLAEGDTKSISVNDKEKNMGRWTREEKQKFIDAIRWHGKDWKKVEQNIKTRSGAQIRSHAQKFFQNKLKCEGIDIDTYILQLQNDEANKDVESSLDDDNNKDQSQEQNYTSYDLTAKDLGNINNVSKKQNKFVSVVDIDGPANKLKFQDQAKNHILKSHELKAFQQINFKNDNESQQFLKRIEKEMLAQQGEAHTIQKPQFLSSSTPSEISSYVQQQKLLKLVNNNNIKDQALLGKFQQKFSSNKNLSFPYSEEQYQSKQNQNILSQLSQIQMGVNNQAQNIFQNSIEQKQKIQKLSPSKLNSPLQNLQRINTARWNENPLHQDQKTNFDSNKQIQSNQEILNSKSPFQAPKIQILSDGESPIKMNIFEDTILEVVNLDLSKIGLEFQQLWDLKMNSKGSKTDDFQIYQESSYLQINQINQDQNANSLQNVQQMPKILRLLKKELENFILKNEKILLLNKHYKIDSIKICWHMNKNELFVYDFQEKVLNNKDKGPISILNIFEKPNVNQIANLRNLQSKQIVKSIQLTNGTYIVIQGQKIQKLSFEIPKGTARQSDKIGRRISIIIFHSKIEQIKLNYNNLEQKQSFSALSLKERDLNCDKSGKTPIFGGTLLTKKNIYKILNKNIEKGQNFEFNQMQGQLENSSELNFQQNSNLGANKKSPSQVNLNSQDGNYKLSKQVRERANSGLTIQSNFQKQNPFNMIKPLFNQQSSKQKSQDFFNQIKNYLKNRQNKSLENVDQKNNVSQFLNQNNLIKAQQQKTSSANRSQEQLLESKSQQESSNSIVFQKTNQYGNNIFKGFIQNDQNKQNLNQQNNDLLNLLQPIIQQKKNQNMFNFQNYIHQNQLSKELNNQNQKTQTLQQVSKEYEYQKKQQNFIKIFKQLKESKNENTQQSNVQKKKENQYNEISQQIQIVDNKNQIVQFGQYNQPLNDEMVFQKQQIQLNAQQLKVQNETENPLLSDRKASESSKQSQGSKSQQSPPNNWDQGLLNLKQQRLQKISGESEIIEKIKASIETPTGGQSKNSQIDSFIGLMRQQNQQIMEDILNQNQNTSNFQNEQYQAENNQIMDDNTQKNQFQDKKKQNISNQQEKQSEHIQDFCTSLKSVQNVLNTDYGKYKYLNDQLSDSSAQTCLKTQQQARKQNLENIINKNFKIIEMNIDSYTLKIINEQKQQLISDLIMNENKNIEQLDQLNQVQNKQNNKGLEKSQLINSNISEYQNENDQQLQRNENLLNSLILKKQFIYYNFINQLKQCFEKEIKSQQVEGIQNMKKIHDQIKIYLGLLTEIQDQLLKLFQQEIHTHQRIRQQYHNRIVQSTKNIINQTVIKEMIEIMNFQILVNMNCHLLKQMSQQLKNDNIESFNLEQICPFNIDKFLKLIPYSYTQHMRSSQMVQEHLPIKIIQSSQIKGEQAEDKSMNKQDILIDNTELINPESFLLQNSPVFNGDSIKENLRNQLNDVEIFGQSSIIIDNVLLNPVDNKSDQNQNILQLQQVMHENQDSFNVQENSVNYNILNK